MISLPIENIPKTSCGSHAAGKRVLTSPPVLRATEVARLSCSDALSAHLDLGLSSSSELSPALKDVLGQRAPKVELPPVILLDGFFSHAGSSGSSSSNEMATINT